MVFHTRNSRFKWRRGSTCKVPFNGTQKTFKCWRNNAIRGSGIRDDTDEWISWNWLVNDGITMEVFLIIKLLSGGILIEGSFSNLLIIIAVFANKICMKSLYFGHKAQHHKRRTQWNNFLFSYCRLKLKTWCYAILDVVNNIEYLLLSTRRSKVENVCEFRPRECLVKIIQLYSTGTTRMVNSTHHSFTGESVRLEIDSLNCVIIRYIEMNLQCRRSYHSLQVFFVMVN